MNYIYDLMSKQHVSFNRSFYVANPINGKLTDKTYYFDKDFTLKEGSMTRGKINNDVLVELMRGNLLIANEILWVEQPSYGQIYYYIVDNENVYGDFEIKKKVWTNNLTDLINLKAGNVFHSDKLLSRKRQETLYRSLSKEYDEAQKSKKAI